MPYDLFSEDLERFVEVLHFWRERDRHGQLGAGDLGGLDLDEEFDEEAGTGDGPESEAIKV